MMLLRVIPYDSTFKTYLNERETLLVTLLLNKYLGRFVDKELNKIYYSF